jgi:hypothetical protein
MLVVGERFAFIHVPKTGGTWVRAALRSLVTRDLGRHVPSSATALPTFGFVREPSAWYESFRSYVMRYQDSAWADLLRESSDPLARLGEDSMAEARRRLLHNPARLRPFEFVGNLDGLAGSGLGFYPWLSNTMLAGSRVFRFEDGLAAGVATMLGLHGLPLPRMDFPPLNQGMPRARDLYSQLIATRNAINVEALP